MTVGHLTPEIVLAVGAVVVILSAAFTSRPHQWVTIPVALAALLVSAAATVVLAATTGPQLSMEDTWALDRMTSSAELLIAGVAAITILLSVGWFQTDPRRGEYPAVVLFAATGAMLLAGAADTMELIIGMLLVSVAGYTLAAFHRGSPAALEAGMKYFLLGALTNTILLLGVVFLYGAAGTTSYRGITGELATGGDRVLVTAAVLCIVVGVVFEIGAVPVHMWVPDVAQGAPAPSAAFLTVAPKIGAVVALARILDLVPDGLVDWRAIVALVAAVTMTLGNLAAFWQDDLRRLLGWSSVAQAGYALMAIVVLNRSDLADPSLIIFLAGYAAATVAAFAVVIQLRGRTAVDDYRGLGAARPWLAAGLTLSLLSLVGVPPLGGFVGKLGLFASTIDGGYAWLAALAVANTVASLFYYLRVIGPLYLEDRAVRTTAFLLGRSAAWAAALATIAVVAVGVVAGPLLGALGRAIMLP